MHDVPKLGKHSMRVAAWIYTVVNPLIEAFQHEGALLDKGNISWHYHSRKLEYIRSVEVFVENKYYPNYEDMLAAMPYLKPEFQTHDNSVASLEVKACEFFDILLRASVFKKQVEKAMQKYNEEIESSKSQYQPLTYMKDDLPAFVAEALINHVDSFPSHYVISRFWEQFSTEFSEYKKRDSFIAIESSAKELLRVTAKLWREMRDYRLMLCQEHDLPAAQFQVSHDSKENVFSY